MDVDAGGAVRVAEGKLGEGFGDAVELFPRESADDADDDPTEDLMTQRLNVHEKNAWMLRSLLQ